jgi:hypothetical protein
VLVLGALEFRDRKETDFRQLVCSVSLIAKRSDSRGRGRVSTKAVAFLGATWTLSRLDLQPSKFEILQVPHCQRDPTGDHDEHGTTPQIWNFG